MRFGRVVLLAGALVTVTLAVLSAGLFTTRNATANPLGGLVSIAAGEDHTCAITDTGGVKCWGGNIEGQLGNGHEMGPFEHEAVPSAPVPLKSVAIGLGSGQSHACVVIDDGSVWCWGDNHSGQLGVSDGPRSNVPLQTQSLSGRAVAVAGGTSFTCALIEDGSVECWGDNAYGQLGKQASSACLTYHVCDTDSEPVQGVTDAIGLAVGSLHTCVVRLSGMIECWGNNVAGQIGDGGATERDRPTQVLGMSDAIQVGAGAYHTCALTNSGGVKCWGQGYGNSAVDVPGLEGGVRAIAAAQSHTCALLTSGGVKCWGDNGFGQLGDGKHCGNTCPVPVDVLGLQDGVAQVATGLFHTCAVLITGTAKCWGMNPIGALGNGTYTQNWAPTDVVESQIKEPPTPTPCAPEGCPTTTPPPAPPRTGLDFSLSIDTDGNGVVDCSTSEEDRNVCSLTPGQQFRAVVTLHALPPDLDVYAGIDQIISFAGVASEHKSDNLWPDCGFPATFYSREFLALGCATPLGGITSTYVGPIGQTLFTCSAPGSITLEHGSGNTAIVGTDLIPLYERQSTSEQLIINCGDTPLAGDVDCSVAVNSVDAQLMLQAAARVLQHLKCPQFADVNLDRSEDAIDSLLTLQYTAGLIGGLPIFPAGP